jgi:transposase InsO family protein
MKDNPRWQSMKPAWYKQAYFLPKKLSQKDKPISLRSLGKATLSPQAQLKLEWMIFRSDHTTGETVFQFGLNRKTLAKWWKRYQDLGLSGLEEISRTPKHKRIRMISLEERRQIRQLRLTYPLYGKMKLSQLYFRLYHTTMSSWHIQKVIEEDHLYPNKVKASKLRKKHVQARIHARKRITELKRDGKANYLWHVDTVILTLAEGGYRYLITAIDDLSKLSFARLYSTHSSRNARDFLERLLYLTDHKVMNIHHDNGSEFKKEFEDACSTLSIPQWYSRVHTPKDNAVLERFNRTIQEEFVEVTDTDPGFLVDFNQRLTDWLIEYNFHRPHKTLDYKTPIEYLDEYYQKVLPMSSSPTPA